MHRAAFGDVELDYEITGAGEPIVLVHHGAGRNWFDPLLEEPASSATTPWCAITAPATGPAVD
jgi:pimeloyl-ACP methyl ester carboxylesterase